MRKGRFGDSLRGYLSFKRKIFQSEHVHGQHVIHRRHSNGDQTTSGKPIAVCSATRPFHIKWRIHIALGNNSNMIKIGKRVDDVSFWRNDRRCEPTRHRSPARACNPGLLVDSVVHGPQPFLVVGIGVLCKTRAAYPKKEEMSMEQLRKGGNAQVGS